MFMFAGETYTCAVHANMARWRRPSESPLSPMGRLIGIGRSKRKIPLR